MSQGKARLDFARPENREFWLAGYQYIKALLMKGTYRTALEWAKLLLSLDPEGDPYCMRFMIHHLALRCHEFQWLLDITPVYNLQIFKESAGSALTPLPMMISQAYAAMALRDGPGCRSYLSEAMQNVPWLFTRLFKELNLDAPKSIWGQEPRTDAESLIAELYVLQTKDLWNTPEATALLMEIAHTIPKADGERFPKIPNTEMTLDVVRFVYLDNRPALMSLVPSQLLHRSNNSDADPLPPDHNIFSYPAQRNAIHGRDGARGGLGDDMFDPLAALARLLPGFRRPEGGNREEQENAINRVLEEIAGGVDDDEEPGNESDEDSEGDERDADVPPGMISRLLNMLWRSGNARVEGESGEWTTDDSMPELVDEDAEGEETDDEMPELVNAE
jgi:hypothetical protein